MYEITKINSAIDKTKKNLQRGDEMRKLVLVFGILASVVSVGMGAMSDEEWNRISDNCWVKRDKNACQTLIDSGLLKSVEQCDKDSCRTVGIVYYTAGRYREAIPYTEKAIALGDNRGYADLGEVYYKLQDYFNAKKYSEIACDKGNSRVCFYLGVMYSNGEGVRQDYAKAAKLYKKACDMKDSDACNNLGFLYGNGLGVKQNLSTAKGYYGKSCDLGFQMGCDNYKLLNSQGVR